MLKQISLIFYTVFLFSVSVFAGQSFKAKVVGVVDGDTITVLTKENRQFMFQLAGIDAPEKGQEFGAEAREFLSNSILNQTVIVSDYKRDCLDRDVALVLFNNKDLSFLAVETGKAWADSACQSDEAMIKRESAARESKIGLWQNSNAVRPSDFRQAKKQQSTIVAQSTGRRIYSRLAPLPLPPVKGFYIGMSLDSFKQKCGETAKMSPVYTTEGYQSFDLKFEDTKENVYKGCAGSFTFRRTADNSPFELRTAYQTL